MGCTIGTADSRPHGTNSPSICSSSVEYDKAVVREIAELGIGTGDIGRLDALCSPDILNQALARGRPPGIGGTREFLRSARRDVRPVRWIESHVVATFAYRLVDGRISERWPIRDDLGSFQNCWTEAP
jgi:hypothetical protein